MSTESPNYLIDLEAAHTTPVNFPMPASLLADHMAHENGNAEGLTATLHNRQSLLALTSAAPERQTEVSLEDPDPTYFSGILPSLLDEKTLRFHRRQAPGKRYDIISGHYTPKGLTSRDNQVSIVKTSNLAADGSPIDSHITAYAGEPDAVKDLLLPKA